MKNTILGSIDTTKIRQDYLYEDRRGVKWLDVLIIETPNSQYGSSHMIVQAVPKEERAKGTRGPILGNGRMFDGPVGGPAPQAAPEEPTKTEEPPPF